MYIKKVYATTFRLLTVVICIGVELFTNGCSRYNFVYNIDTNDKNINAPKIDEGKKTGNNSYLFQVDADGKTLFCKAIERGDYERLKDLLKKIAYPNTIIFDDVVCLITGYKVDKECNKQYPKRALLEQVITSYEGELSQAYTYTKELLNILFEIICNYGFGLKEAFLQKHGDDENTLIHLGVNTANLAIVECLVGWLKKSVSNDNDLCGLIKVCSMRNRRGITPLSMVEEAMYHSPLVCGTHIYDCECETHDDECLCDYEIEKRVERENILLYLLGLGVPWLESIETKIESVLHYFIRYDAGYFLIEIMETMQKRVINKCPTEDLVSLKDKKCNSLLFYAVRCRDYKLAEYLLALGACPIQVNHKGVCPTLLAVAFRDIKMVGYLSKARCVQERICNINRQNSNGLRAMDVARSPDGCGMCPRLEEYCSKFEKKYARQIVHNEWDWRPNDEIAQRISYLDNFFKVNSCARKRKGDHIYFRLDLGFISLFSGSWVNGG